MTRPRSLPSVSSARVRRGLSIAVVILGMAAQALAIEGAETETSENSPDRVGMTLRVNVREVGIFFSAVGQRNRSLPSVNPDDVTVLDDGVPAQVTSVRTAELPIRLGLLMDASASVGNGLETEVSIASNFAVRILRDEDRAWTMMFASKPEPLVEVSSGTSVATDLRNVDAAGLTALYDSVIEACSELAAPGNARKVVVLLSDGDDTNSYHRQNEVYEVAERSAAIVYTVYIRTKTSGRENERWMKRLAEVTGGRSFNAFGPRELESALDEIERDIRSGYVLTFRPPNQFATGKFHQVSVRPRQRDISIRAQAGYVPR